MKHNDTNGRTDDPGPMNPGAGLTDDELRSGEIGQTVEQPPVDEAREVDGVFEVDGDTTGADPDAPDPAVFIQSHEPGHLA